MIVLAVESKPTSGKIVCQQQLVTIYLDTTAYITVKSNRNHSEFMGQAESFALCGTNATNVVEWDGMEWKFFLTQTELHVINKQSHMINKQSHIFLVSSKHLPQALIVTICTDIYLH